MASSNLTLYNDEVNSEVFAIESVVGKDTTYSSDASTPTFPVILVINKESKPIGNLSNNRLSLSIKRAGDAASQGSVRTSSATLTVSVAKDPGTAAELAADAAKAIINMITYFTGAAPSSTVVTRATNFVAGKLV